jgi:hypothetical protein
MLVIAPIRTRSLPSFPLLDDTRQMSKQISVEVCIWGYSNVEEFGISSSGFEVPDPEPNPTKVEESAQTTWSSPV